MLKVLLVDDEPSVIQLLENVIDWKTLGFTICGTASNGEDALEILKQSNPHLAIIDIRMPGMNGLQLLKAASEILYLRTKFVILSAYNDFQYAKTAMRYGAVDYILKPIDDDEVVPVLERVKKQIDIELSAREAEVNKLKFAANNYINRLIKDEASEGLNKRCKRILRVRDNDVLKCALIEIDEFAKWMNELDDNEIRKKRLSVRKTIEYVTGNVHIYNIFDDEINRFGIILNQEMLEREEEYLENIKNEILNNCNCSVSVSLSEADKGIDNIEKLYKEALIALQYGLFQTDRNVLYYKNFKNTSLDYNFYNSNPEDLLKDIKSNNKFGIMEKINNVFEEFCKRKCAPEVIESYIKNIEFEMVKYILEHEGSVNEFIGDMESIGTSVGKTCVTSLRDDFCRVALNTADYYKSISSRSSKDIVIEIKDFIHQNYHKDLKLQQVAKTYFVNSVYLGQIFTKTIGMHFNEYLHSVRINEAKKLLRRTDMKICAIAAMVGYNDSEYFVSKFKAITHRLPSDYRKSSMIKTN
ncbi:response regulator transcription factor [Clostridium oryzae]|uniref:Stage 0 sporulation protein A homolog n=1 Tax=Clostridium oryzae TaxID=1450648 RepID=A0A1V4INL9_9CLOT|nr:response regulator [Clostridium oryzae]OPJ61390.1 putative response regulatory protein [Clostridium oryzae]